MTLDISATSPRVQYTVGSSSTTTFAYGFPIFQDADLKVFVGSTLKTLTTHYTVTGAGTTSGGNVVMTTGNEVTNADVTIVRDITISRTTDFPTSGSFQVDSLNTELDTITAVQQELEDDISRSLKLSDEDATATLTLPLKDARKGRYLAFNATTGNAEAGPTQTDATAIASVTSDIALLADIQDGTTATNALTNLANIHGNITTVAGIHGNVTTVAGKASEITTIATGTTGGNSNLTNLNTIATGTTGGNANLTQINAVATNATNINTVADADSNISALNASGVIGNIGTVAGIASNVTTVAGQNTNITTLANISSDITSLANSLEKTYTVTVAGGVFVLDGSNNPAIEVFRGNAYIFNQNDATNDGHPLVFKNGSSAYQDGVKYYLNGSETSYANYYNTTNFNAGRSSGDRKVIIEVASTAPSSGLRYYCYVHGNGMGNTITVKDSNFSLVATNIANVNNVGNNITAVSNVHTNMTKVSNVYTNMSDINALNGSGVISNIGTLATGTTGGNANLTQINTVAGAVSDINTVATNISGVNSFADRYRISSSAPTSSLDVGDLYFDTTANELKVYKSSGWSAAGSTVNGTSARFHYNITGSTNTVTGADANGNTLAYDAGFIDVYVNGVRMSPDDITITSGTSVVFASALANGDDVDIVAFGTFQVANIVSTGALNSGSITSGFGNIDTGSSTITTTGAISGGTLTGGITTLNDDVTFDSTNSSSYDLTWDSSEGKLRFNDSARIELGTDGDAFLKANHVGTSFFAESIFLLITNTRENGDIKLSTDDGSGGTATYVQCDGGTGEVKLYHYGSEKLATKSTGVDITDVLTTTGNVGIGQSNPTSPNGATTFLHIGDGDEQDTSIVLQDGVEIWEIYQNDNLHFRYDTTDVMTMERLTGNIGLGGITTPSFTSGNGVHLADDFKIGFGAGGNSRPDFQLGYSTSSGNLELACGFGADTGDIQINSSGQLQFLMAGGNTALYFMDSSNSNYGVAGFEPATYNGGTNRLYTLNTTHLALATNNVIGLFMKHDTRQVTLSYGGQNYPANTVAQLTIGYSLGSNKGGMYMPTYSYYSSVCFNVTNNDTNNGRQHDDIIFHRNGYRHGGIRIIGGSGVSYQSVSDYREKTDEKPIEDAIGTIKKLKPYNFKWKKSGVRQDGFFAHEVDEVLDYAVSGEKDATKTYEGVVLNKDGNMIASEIKKEDFDKRLIDKDDEEASPKGETTYPEGSTWKETYEDIEPQQMDPAKLVPMLTACLQEAIAKIETLETKVKALEEA